MLCRAARGWLIGATVLLYSAIGIALGQQLPDSITRNPYEQTGHGSERTEPPHVQAPAPERPERPAYTARYQRACDQPTSREEADLCQQWRMAEASEELVEIADRQFWATVAEITALFLVLVFTALATIAASRSAKSASLSSIATQKAADAAIDPIESTKTPLCWNIAHGSRSEAWKYLLL